jgi:hypothetical protein
MKQMKNTSDKKPGYIQRHWLLFFMLLVLLGAIGKGCIPPPPRQAPKLPRPSGGPNPATMMNVRPVNNFNNFSV